MPRESRPPYPSRLPSSLNSDARLLKIEAIALRYASFYSKVGVENRDFLRLLASSPLARLLKMALWAEGLEQGEKDRGNH
jgi:hypothetical protein